MQEKKGLEKIYKNRITNNNNNNNDNNNDNKRIITKSKMQPDLPVVLPRQDDAKTWIITLMIPTKVQRR